MAATTLVPSSSCFAAAAADARRGVSRPALSTSTARSRRLRHDLPRRSEDDISLLDLDHPPRAVGGMEAGELLSPEQRRTASDARRAGQSRSRERRWWRNLYGDEARCSRRAVRLLGLSLLLQAGFPRRQGRADLPFPAGVLVPVSGRHAMRSTSENANVKILGLNAFHGDASAALLEDGQLVAALEEERLNRIKHWAGFPALAARACLEQGGPGAAGPRGDLARSARALLDQGRAPGHPPGRLAAIRLARQEHGRCRPARQPARRGRHRQRRPGPGPFRRAPSRPSGQRVLRLAVRRSGGRLDRRVRRLQQRDVGRRPRQPDRRPRQRSVPALARPVLHGVHPVARLPEVRRRIQDDGPVGLRHAALRARWFATSCGSRAIRSASTSTTSSITPPASR